VLSIHLLDESVWEIMDRVTGVRVKIQFPYNSGYLKIILVEIIKSAINFIKLCMLGLVCRA